MFAALAAIWISLSAIAFTINGRVVDATSGEPVAGAVVHTQVAPTGSPSATTDADGYFRITLDGPATLVIEHEGYATAERQVSAADSVIEVALAPQELTTARQLEGLTITASRAGSDAPVAKTTLDKARLERDYSGQDVPLTLRDAPAVTAYSESGSLLNYSYFRLRGIDQTRINMTLDGVPLNEPEDQQIYFSDFPDFTSSIESVQIERGVGTSTYGQAAFGGSVNFASRSLADEPRLTSLQLGGGSFGDARATLEAQSGQLPDRFAFYGRASGLRSDGYREGASTAANGGFVSGGYFGDRDLIKMTAATGLERNGQSYDAVPDSTLRRDQRFNPLAGVGDHYRESFATLNYTRLISANASAGLTGYGFLTSGFYDYPSGAPGPALRYRSASRWVGLIAAAHATEGAFTIDGGAHAETYSKDHAFDARPDLGYPAYDNTGYKTEESAFGKASLALGAATLFADLQLRSAEFRYQPTAGYGLAEASQRWNFVNPRVGVTVRPASRVTLYASYGTTGREPTRNDLFAGSDDVTPDDAPALLPLTRVRPEHVNDLETGATVKFARVSFSLDAYDMRFRDEIARTGAFTPLGYDIRANVDRSYRRGVELDGDWLLTSDLDIGVSAAFSRNRINAYLDQSTGTTYRNVDPILTPTIELQHRITWRPVARLELTGDGRYVGRTFLAPTGDRSLTTPPYYVLDGGATVTLGGARSLLIEGRNLLNRWAYPSGDVGDGEPLFYILAPRSADVTVRIAW